MNTILIYLLGALFTTSVTILGVKVYLVIIKRQSATRTKRGSLFVLDLAFYYVSMCALLAFFVVILLILRQQ